MRRGERSWDYAYWEDVSFDRFLQIAGENFDILMAIEWQEIARENNYFTLEADFNEH